ncbi:transmembrane protein, putative [Medicago truncatula]|uniref:Transmembrane protein, putative n=1 Tax=Medicago truncatula TaxID=3880 RepID=A0A072TUE0_MEDTR|nr:transmembrane protein, putative [Medicago truncatula]
MSTCNRWRWRRSMRCHGRRKERFFFAGEFFRGGGVSGVVQRRSRWCQREPYEVPGVSRNSTGNWMVEVGEERCDIRETRMKSLAFHGILLEINLFAGVYVAQNYKLPNIAERADTVLKMVKDVYERYRND